MLGLDPKVDLNFFIDCILEEVIADAGSICLKFTNNININIESAVYFKTVIAGEGGNQLKVLVGHKVIDAQKNGRGNLLLAFDNNEPIVILELDLPYESYTMQTPEGLVVV